MRSLKNWLANHRATFPIETAPNLGTGEWRRISEMTVTVSKETRELAPEHVQYLKESTFAELFRQVYKTGEDIFSQPVMLSVEELQELDSTIYRFRIEHAERPPKGTESEVAGDAQ